MIGPTAFPPVTGGGGSSRVTPFQVVSFLEGIARAAGEKIKVSFDIKNTGKREGAEAAQLYIRDVESSEPRPVKELKGLAKVFLKPGTTKRVEVELGESVLSFYSANKNKWTAEPGEYEVMVGRSSADIKLRALFTLQ